MPAGASNAIIRRSALPGLFMKAERMYPTRDKPALHPGPQARVSVTRRFMVGAVLLAVSFPPLFLMARELAIASSVKIRYTLEDPGRPIPEPGFAQETRLGRARIQLADDAPAEWRGRDPFEGPVRVFVNGRSYGTDAMVRIRPFEHDANRYWGFINLLKVTDSYAGTEHVVVGQRLDNGMFRLLWVDADATVTAEEFSYQGRCGPPVRAAIIRYIVPSPSGFCSDVMTAYPSLLFPFLYPWVSGIAGLLLTVKGGVAWRGRRKTA